MKAPSASICALKGSVTMVPVRPIGTAVSAQHNEHYRIVRTPAANHDRARRGRGDYWAAGPFFRSAGPFFRSAGPLFLPVSLFLPASLFLPVSLFLLASFFLPASPL